MNYSKLLFIGFISSYLWGCTCNDPSREINTKKERLVYEAIMPPNEQEFKKTIEDLNKRGIPFSIHKRRGANREKYIILDEEGKRGNGPILFDVDQDNISAPRPTPTTKNSNPSPNSGPEREPSPTA